MAMEAKTEAALALLAQVAERREQRRGYEWKVTLGIWAGLLLASKVVADAESLHGKWQDDDELLILVGLLLAGVVFGHFAYHRWFVRPAMRHDLEAARVLEKEVRTSVTLPGPTKGDEVGYISSAFQVYVTALLAVLAYAVIDLTLFAAS